ncbi:hypothetical protein PAESOLCIP111_05494 [Paenibacillus solanacearum]|uniref:Extracellular solute-binding protein n=1 Tax=Paenibacillus solanacearum TaxID=2048548 RepID=A0A916NYP0_9BACL|nr:extracellular solute-binding protein [Paenibacillus solanacearum]CAG7647960.1 hypothetical protein PAESOLCIP111_05494 [Paenibacillus solanacearum]
MEKSILSIIVATVLLGLTACDGSGESNKQALDQGSGTKEQQQVQSKPKEPITLYIQNIYSGSPTPEDFMATYGKLIQQKFPHIQKVEYFTNTSRPLTQAIISNDPMDIIITSQATFHSGLLANKLQTDISDLISQKKYDLNKLDPSSIELIKTLGGGKIYGLPVDAGGTYLVYNKDIFDKFGLPYPPDHMTWEQFMDLSKKLSRTEGGVQYHGSAFAPVNFMIRNPYALEHTVQGTDKADFSNPNWSGFLTQIVDVFKIPGNEKTVAQLGTSGALDLFRKEKVAAMYSPIVANDLSLTFGFEGMNFDYTQFPTMPGAPGNVQTYPNIYAVSSTSQHKEDAFDVIAFMTSEEIQLTKSKQGSFTPLNNAAMLKAFGEQVPDGIKGKNLKIFMEPNKYKTPTHISEYLTTANNELNTVLNEVITGTKDINTALREATDKANQKIEQAKNAKK